MFEINYSHLIQYEILDKLVTYISLILEIISSAANGQGALAVREVVGKLLL